MRAVEASLGMLLTALWCFFAPQSSDCLLLCSTLPQFRKKRSRFSAACTYTADFTSHANTHDAQVRILDDNVSVCTPTAYERLHIDSKLVFVKVKQ